ncbi:MAG: TAXI family TRAP transporter solute-binding subunit [Betaproteobacteria bacterium]|nr:TAXI family TRAP transporter solute-binding subunit [Betaproteobacteria bacterium]
MASDKVFVTLGTATPGGGFPVYGQAVTETINAADATLELRQQNTQGSTENVPLLDAGKIDLGLVTGEVVYEALAGIGRPKADLRVLSAMYSSPGMFVLRADSPARSIEDLKGKPVVFGAKGSGLVVLARYVLDGLGLDIERDFKAVYLDRAGDGPKMVLEGEAAALWGGGIGWPGFRAMAESAVGARFIVPDADGIRRILAKHRFLRALTVPANSYPGQSEPIASLGSWSFIMARPGLDESVAYRLAKALHRSEAQLAQRLAQARETTASNTIAAATSEQLHPGVLRYFRAAGLIKP